MKGKLKAGWKYVAPDGLIHNRKEMKQYRKVKKKLDKEMKKIRDGR